MSSTFTKIQVIILVVVSFCIINAFAASSEDQADIAGNAVVQTAETVSESNGNTINDGFLNGIKYGISYPFVFWGAEGFQKVPWNEMSGSFMLGTFVALIGLLLVGLSIFALKK